MKRTMLGRRTALKAGAGAALFAPAIVRAQAGMKLDLSTVWPDSNFHAQNCRRFAEEVGKATNGAVQITVHVGGALGYKGPSSSTRYAMGWCRWPTSSTSSR